MTDSSSSLSPGFLQSMEEPLPGGMLGLGAGSLSGLSGLGGGDPRPEEVVPYLDVMTVSSAAITSKSGAKTQYGSHTRMFSEPISIPSLRHTGLSTSLLDSGPAHSKLELFYSNGTKKFNLRDTIKEKLEQSKRGPGMPGGGDSSLLFGDGLGGTASTLGQSASAASLLSSLGTSGVPLGLAHQAPALGSLDMSVVSSMGGRGPASGGGGPQSRRRKGGGGRRRQRGGKLQAMSAGRPSPMLSSMADRSMGGGGGPPSESRRAQLGQSRGSFLSNIHTRPRDAQTKLVLAKLRHTVNRLEAQSAIIVRGREGERERERERENDVGVIERERDEGDEGVEEKNAGERERERERER